jgi:hypothetical protein
MRFALSVALLGACAFAQSLPEPPALIRLTRTYQADPNVASRFVASPVLAMLGMSTLTGPSETWYLEALDSFTALEQTDRALRPLGSWRGLLGDSVPHTSNPPIGTPSASWVAVYRSWLSYRPLEASQALFRARYFQALVFRVNPDDEDAFVDAVRARKASLDGLNLDRPEMAYQVASGAETLTYVFLAPLPSLKLFDEGLARLPAYARAAAKTAAAGKLRHEHFLLRVEPILSMVPDALAQADPDFWRGNGAAGGR